jgi:dCMP deaminase
MGSTSISEAFPEPTGGRQSWNKYFLDLAQHISTRSTCTRAQVGAVFVRDHFILSTGYNGSLPGRDHCCDVGCLVIDNHCARCVHAETNALAQAAKHGVSLDNSWLYVTHLPCYACFKIILAAGVSRVYYGQKYGDTNLKLYQDIQGMSRLEQVKPATS